jgi:hypothetical protein
LLTPLQHQIFYVDPRVHVKMNRLKTIATWIPLIPQLKKLHNSRVIIQALNTTSLHQHYENINLEFIHVQFYIPKQSSNYNSIIS